MTERERELTSIQILRRLVQRFGCCREDFNDRFTVAELLLLDSAWSRSGWDIYPDQWTKRQVTEALRGIAPTWDDNERPTHSTDQLWRIKDGEARVVAAEYRTHKLDSGKEVLALAPTAEAALILASAYDREEIDVSHHVYINADVFALRSHD